MMANPQSEKYEMPRLRFSIFHLAVLITCIGILAPWWIDWFDTNGNASNVVSVPDGGVVGFGWFGLVCATGDDGVIGTRVWVLDRSVTCWIPFRVLARISRP